jgi:hypothetical protein
MIATNALRSTASYDATRSTCTYTYRTGAGTGTGATLLVARWLGHAWCSDRNSYQERPSVHMFAFARGATSRSMIDTRYQIGILKHSEDDS